MPGCWEIVQQTQVLVCTLTTETVTTAWASNFKHLQVPGQFTFLSGMPFGHARNSAAQLVMENGFQYCFFLDSDVICPPDTIIRLMAHRQPIVSGLYYRRNEPLFPVMLRNVEAGREWIQEYRIPDLLEVDYVGAGCLLIHRSVFEKVPKPYFEWKVDRMDLPERERMSEDFSFCEKAKASGFKVLVDTSVQCVHCGYSGCKLPGELKPLTVN